MITVRFKARIDTQRMRTRVDKWQEKILKRTGAAGRTIMRRLFRPPVRSSQKWHVVYSPSAQGMWFGTAVAKHNIHLKGGQQRWRVPSGRGFVMDYDTDKPVDKQSAMLARQLLRIKLSHRTKGEVGKPPRRGPTDKLRRFTVFEVDKSTESVLIGATKFPKQPPLVGRVSVPNLLDKGGGEYVGGVLAHYGERPFVDRVLAPTYNIMQYLILTVRI